MADWSPQSWRDYPAAQQPDWPDTAALESALDELRAVPPLVFAGEARSLTDDLARAADGQAFVLQAGDCAESFDVFSANAIRDKLKVILQMAVVLTYGSGVPTVKIGRIAGQFAKPRSAPTEARDGIELPSFRGDMVNDFEFDADARRPDPSRLVRAYHQSASTLNLLRAFAKGGFADLSRAHAWNLEFLDASPEGLRYEALAGEIDRALRFMEACGIDLDGEAKLHEVDFYTSHEALILGLRRGAHARRHPHRPVVRLLGPPALDRRANTPARRRARGVPLRYREPDRREARARGHRRRGARALRAAQPRAPSRSPHAGESHGGRPRHRAAAAAAARGARTQPSRALDLRPDARQHVPARERLQDPRLRRRDAEVHGFFAACDDAGVWPGGVHVELTGEDVTECLGGSQSVLGGDLEQRYESECDPRLNARQSLDLAFQTAELLRR